MRELTVFLSSRFGENNFLQLRDELKTAIESAFKYQNLEVIALEKVNDPRTPLKASIQETEASNLFVHILGETYGSTLVEYDNKSYTHIEYEVAKNKKIPIVSVVIGDIYCADPPKLSDDNNFKGWQKDVLYNNNIQNIKFQTQFDIKEVVKQVLNDIGNLFNLSLRNANKNQSNTKLYATIPSLIDKDEYIKREEIEEIKKSLLGDSKEIGITSTSRQVGLHGMGGIGKTVTAIALAHDKDLQQYFTDGIYFVTIGRNPNIKELQSQLLEDGFSIDDANPSVAKIREVFQNKKALLVLDNVWEVKHIKEFDISTSLAKVLITSRQKDILRGKIHTIDILSPEQAIRLFKNITGDINQELEGIAKYILEECGFLPLAVHIIGYTLRSRKVDDYKNILDRLKKSQTNRISLRSVENEEHKNLFEVINISFDYLEDWIQDYYLSLSIFKDENYITKETLQNYWGDDFFDVKNSLIDASLLKEEVSKSGFIGYTLHDLQKDFLVIKDNIGERYQKYIKIYSDKYSNRWEDIEYRDIFFHYNYIDIYSKADNKNIVQDITKGLLKNYKYFTIESVQKLIKYLHIDKKETIEKLLDTNKNNGLLVWILKNLDLNNKKSIKFAKKYLELDANEIDGNLTIKCLDIANINNKELAEEFAKKYLELDANEIDGHITIKCLDIANINNKELTEEFAKSYFLEKDLNEAIIRKCFAIVKKDYKEAIEYAEKYIEKNFNNLGNFTVNIALYFLQDNNEYKQKIGLREFSKLNKNKTYLKSNPDRKSMIFNIPIADKRLREKVILQELTHQFHFFPTCNKFFFRNNRTLINSCLLAFQEKPKKTVQYSKKILNYYDEELKFKDTRNLFYHWHIKTALENLQVQKYAIDIAKKILIKENKLTLEAVINNNCDFYYISWILDDTIFELIKVDIKDRKNNVTAMQKISKLLFNLYDTRKKIYNLCLENKVLQYINIVNVVSYYQEVIGNIAQAIEYKEEALLLVGKSKLLDKEEKFKLYSQELNELRLKESI